MGVTTSKMKPRHAVSTSNYPYIITTFTSSRTYSGTDAKVFVVLYGDLGESDIIPLTNGSNKNPFETGRSDVFKVTTKELGLIYKVKVWHDNSGTYPGWFLNKIHVEDGKTERKFVFSCFRWLAKGTNYSTEAQLTLKELPVVKIDQLDDDNRKIHHTDKFKSDAFIIRRGQHFRIDLYLARDYDATKDQFSFVLTSGRSPRAHNKTLVHVPLVSEFDDTDQLWGFKIIKSDGKKLQLEINCPADSLVSQYELSLEADDDPIYIYPKPVYILFNPWCEQDEVFMKEEDRRKEYVLREHGSIFVGNSRWSTGRKWYFGQFEEISLTCVFQLLAEIKPSARDTAVKLSRRVSALVNSNDDQGLLVGNWSGNYEDGKEPTFWTSSPPIFEEYSKDCCPVRYGQCWVFSALVTSVLRCLGIPCRSLTNFNSAHDTEQNASHDIYLDEEGEELERMTGDSIWNFHCWNDAWMSRPDLLPGYGGWQAIDATPQELSRGLFQMGPTSLRAVKEGEVNLSYDTRFVLAEVNSDVIYWQKNKDTKQWEAVDSVRTHVGKNISTKAVGSYSRHDITNDYKYPEGSVLERAAVKKALAKSGNIAVRGTPKDVSMEFILPESVEIGQDIVVTVHVKSTGEHNRRLKLVFGGQVLRYNGVAKQKLEHVKKTEDVEKGSESKVVVTFGAKNYIPHLNENAAVRFYVTCMVQETGQVITLNDIVEINKPEIVFENFPKEIKIGQELKGVLSVKNPLQVDLTDAKLILDGSLWQERLTLETDTIKAGQVHKFPISITVRAKLGSRSLLASFTSKQISGLYGALKVRVTR